MEQQNISPNQSLNSDMSLPSNTNRKLIIFGFVLLLLVGSGSYFLGARSQQNNTKIIANTPSVIPTTFVQNIVPTSVPTLTSNPASNEIANWKSYTKFDFSFQLPPSFELEKSDTQGMSFREGNSNNKEPSIFFTVGYPFTIDNQGTHFKCITNEECYQKEYQMLTDNSDRKLNKIQSIVFGKPINGMQWDDGKSYLSGNTQYFYSFPYSYHGEYFTIEAQLQNYSIDEATSKKMLIDQILSTFQFTSQ